MVLLSEIIMTEKCESSYFISTGASEGLARSNTDQ